MLISLFIGELRLAEILILGIILFVSAYLLFRFTLSRFIYEKIRLIYKTIHNLKVSKEQDRKIDIDRNTLEDVNRQVLEWGERQQQEIAQLRELARYRREFLGNVSHELKTPIFNIQGYVLTLLDGGLEDETINREYLLKTEQSIERMITVVEDLEAISKLESGELKLQMVRFDLVELTKEIIDFLDIKTKKKKVRIFLEKNYDKPIFVNADKKGIRQVLVNLIDNSIKYGLEQGGETRISFFDMDEHILTEVTDNGHGVDPKDMPRLFERFYRTDKARSREQGGSGLGLAIVKHMIEAHGQVINVRSTVGVGTTFAFTLRKG
ncbi:MAG: sensor histidine kinase [Bacteroidales bacterium]|nr:sensor histidine kinase [Bacteroidales bacterium]